MYSEKRGRRLVGSEENGRGRLGRTVDILLYDDRERPKQALLERRECRWIRRHDESALPIAHAEHKTFSTP